MREFKDITAFRRFLSGLGGQIEHAEAVGLEDAAKMVEAEAKHSIGTYQEATGPFNAWVPLSSATLDGFFAPGIGYVPGKVELGYAPPDNPLLREGHLRESISHHVAGHEATVGSPDPVALWQECGTADARFPIPPRSFLGGALSRTKSQAVDLMVAPIVRALAGLPVRNRAQPAKELVG
jgi:hypothetical protein